MIEPPSRQLRDGLLRLNICRHGDFRACRRRVRRLARDLPCFDSVWIDALLQARKLTPFQARLAGTGNLSRLSIGPCVLVDQLGAGRTAQTFLARQRDGTERCVLKLIQRPPESIAAALAHLDALRSQGNGFAHPSLVVPLRCLEHEGRLVTISRFVPGLHLEDLLIRRGRFSAETVFELARQLVDVLAGFSAAGGVHGDIVLRNVRLTSAGVAVLVDAGVAPAVRPHLTIDPADSPDKYDGTAPELIGTGETATFASDVFALGCLLWHLLAGRPPFSNGDPLAKLAALQTRTVPDVREWAPHTPAALAEPVRGFTSRDPQQRIEAFQQARQAWGPPKRRGQRRLAGFRATFRVAVPRRSNARGGPPLIAWMVLLMLLSGAALTLFDAGAGNAMLSLPPRLSQLVDRWAPAWAAGALADHGGDGDDTQRAADDGTIRTLSLKPLPPPDPLGVIALRQPGPYAAADITHVGTLTIRSDADEPAVVIIDERPLSVSARRLVLENLHVCCLPGSGRAANGGTRSPPPALMLVHAQHVSVHGCRFETVAEGPTDSPNAPVDVSRPIALAWKPVDPHDQAAGQLEFVDTLFFGPGPGLYCSLSPNDVRIDNCLKIGGTALVSLAEVPETGQTLRIRLSRLTLRDAQSLMRLKQSAAVLEAGRVAVDADQSVLAVDGPQAAMFQLFGDIRPAELASLLELSGEGTVVPPGTAMARWSDSNSGVNEPLEPDAVRVEGLIAHGIQFAGPASRAAEDSVLSEEASRVPSRFAAPPGIDAARLAPRVSRVQRASASARTAVLRSRH